jgi:NAD(P)-dependent dehydrogenase (short-subunit alcohol dehydrogenase family)
MLESARFGEVVMTDRVVVVTGSSGGIGSAIASRFTGAGDVVVGLDLLEGVDVSQPDDCRAATDRVVAAHGRIDVLCNNAGVGAVGDVTQAAADDWQRVFAVNVFGIAHLSAAVIPIMRRQGHGAIVNTCSVVAAVGLVERAIYGASKGAVLGLTRAMAADEAEHGIRVNCVSPGTVDGPWVRRLIEQSDDPAATRAALERRQPLGRLVGPEEVAKAVAFLAADTTFTTGQELLLDGGITGVRIVR